MVLRPEPLHRAFAVGIDEVLLEVEAQHAAQADGHVRIAAEIEIDLEGIGYGSQPDAKDRGRPVCHGVKAPVCDECDVIGDQNLFGESDEEPADAFAEIVHGDLPVVDLFLNLHVPDNGPCDQLGEEGDIESQEERILLGFRISPIDIDDVGHGLERKEGDPDGQNDVGLRDQVCEDLVDIADGEIQVLKYEEDRQIQQNTGSKDDLGVSAVCFVQQDPQQIIQRNRGKHHEDEFRFAPGVENDARQKQKVIPRVPLQEMIDRQDDREEYEYEYQARKQHKLAALSKG